MSVNNRSTANPLLGSSQAWIICGMAMLFYCFNYFIRVSPSVMQSELSQAFHINATQFGVLASFYYWAYTPMQLPAGMLYDKFGARFVLCLACLTAVIGLGIFISADSYGVAGSGRFLIGLGCAFAYIGVLKLASIWLPPNRFATVAGLTTAVGMFCAALSQNYLASVVHIIGYKEALRSILFIGFILSGLIVLIVRNRPKQLVNQIDLMHTPMNSKQLFSSVWIILRNPQMWLIGMIGLLLYLPSSVALDLWGNSYLKVAYHLTTQQALTVTNLMYLGWIISGPIIGAYSDKIQRRCLPLIVTTAIAATLLCVVFYVPGITTNQLYFIIFGIGFSCGAHPLCFSLGKENCPNRISGTAVAVTNMFIMLGGLIFQPLVGKLLDLHTTSPLGPNGLPIYTASDYTFALSVVPLGIVLSFFLCLLVKETYCRSRAKEEDELVFAHPSAMKLAAEAELG